VVRKGYRFKGSATVLREGEVFDKVKTMFSEEAASRTRAVVVIEVSKAEPLISPVYDWGMTEDEVRAQYKQRLVELYGPF
jgi:hypothetical protein